MFQRTACIRLAGLLVVAIPLSGSRCGPHEPSDSTTLTINAPVRDASFGNGSTFAFQATATSAIGIASIELNGGGSGSAPMQQLALCEASGASFGVAGDPATCSFTFAVNSHTNLVSDGSLLLTANATDRRSHVTLATVTINVKAFTCQFIEPGTDTALASVGSISNVVVQVSNDAIPLASVVVTADSTPLLKWPMTGHLDAGPEAGEWEAWNVVETWPSKVGVGMHSIGALCTDKDGNQATDTLQLNVGCGSDSDCPAGDRCCSEDGDCHPTVADGADCDCQHPCASDEGCLPGFCDAASQKCRPGCFPGSDNPPPYGTAPASCAAQDGLPSFCTNLPADQITPQNMGGACAVGDNCDPVSQDCPNLPLNRSQPATTPICTTLSASCPNPTVPENCVPIAQGVNGCVPAGNIPVGGTNCGQACGETTGNCVKGAWCTQAVDGDGNPLGPPTCTSLQSCGTTVPLPGFDGGCPAGESCQNGICQ